MLTKLIIRNFKLFDEVEIELGDRVIFIGPNNAGKTSALQALALWDAGVKGWMEKHGGERAPKKRPGVTLNRRDMIAAPVPSAVLLWRDRHVRKRVLKDGKQGTGNIVIELLVEGVDAGRHWTCGLEFDYTNEESFYCRALKDASGQPMPVPPECGKVRVAYLPPMSGLAANELRLDEGAINVRLGEGRTAETLRNLCWQVLSTTGGRAKWARIVKQMTDSFGITLDDPEYVKERGEITLTYRTREKVRLDISSGGRGQQQTLLLLAHMTANPGSILLLDEPDAHLEILRQRQIYQLLSETTAETGSQIIAASHSEIMLNEAAGRDVVVAFVGKPHRIDNRGSQVQKALRDYGFEHYYQAEEVGWVLYLEGSTDLAILKAFADLLGHSDAARALERPFVHYVLNQPSSARDHFYGLREAKPDLAGVALYDRSPQTIDPDPVLQHLTWHRREIENYLCQKETLLKFAQSQGQEQHGPMFGDDWTPVMEELITKLENALTSLGKPSPWSPEIKASDEFLDPLFEQFYAKLGLPNLMRKTDYHILARHVPANLIDPEVTEKLDAILRVSRRARPRG